MSVEKDLFQKYNGEKIAIYGLGIETQKVLFSLEDRFEIIGLLDSFQEEGRLYGREILSLRQALERGVRLIIVAARPGSCKAIVRKIGDACREHNTAVMDARGTDLLEWKRVSYDFSDIEGGTSNELFQKIAQAEVVSFDLFDTLIMRETLFSADIIELTEGALRKKGVCIHGFSAMRLGAEKKLSKYSAPTLEEIYADMKKRVGEVAFSPSEAAGLEWETDYKTIVPRQVMCGVFDFCISQGKKVYIVTDTYYCKKRIEAILKKCQISGYTEVLVSCEYGAGKRQGLFNRLKELEKDRKCLHIGDDEAADIEMASKEGMETFRVCRGEELLDAVGYMGMKPYMDSLAERLKIGMFAASLFNDPFQFESEQKIQLQNAYDIGYLLCAPIITDFVLWFRRQVQRHGIKNIWFCARDGYLIRKMYQMLDENADTIYFHTSRMAAVRAGIQDEADLSYVDSMRFSGTLGENLETRFGIKADEADIGDGGRSGLMKYKNSILENARLERKKYKEYMNVLRIKEGDIAFFDFVAKGTTQMFVQRLVGNHLKGLYFLQLEPDSMRDKGLDIEPFYKTGETDGSMIYENYYMLETILTAPHPSICGFDDLGNAVYSKETRKAEDIRCIKRVQEGIMDYFCRYLELLSGYMRNSSKELDEVILGLINHLKIVDRDFLSLVLEDPFFNRTTGIEELICPENTSVPCGEK